MRIGVLASGSGTNFQAILEAGLDVEVLLVDRPCGAESVAAKFGVPVLRVLRKDFGQEFDRDAYTRSLVDALAPLNLDLLVMAGFMSVVGPALVNAYLGRIVNTHPALLPSFPGAHAVAEALAANVRVTGCTIHIVTAEVDDGPILAQEPVAVYSNDTTATLHERIKEVERRLYPQVIKELVAQWQNEH